MASAPKVFQSVLAGHRLHAQPLRTEGGQTTWRVSVSGPAGTLGHFETKYSGQLGAAQLGADTPLRRQVLAMVAQQRRAPAVLNVDIEAAARRQQLAGGRGHLGLFGSGVHLPFIVPDFASARAQSIAREHGLRVHTQRREGRAFAVPQSSAQVDLPNTERGGRIYARMAHQEVGWRGSQGGLPLPAGASPAFLSGYREERQHLAREQAIQAVGTLLYGAAGAAAARAATAGAPASGRSGPLALRGPIPTRTGIEPPRSPIQAQLARHPATALQRLDILRQQGAPVSPADANFALRVNRQAFLHANGGSGLTSAQRAYLARHGPAADRLASDAGAGARASGPTTRVQPARNDPFSAIVPKVSQRSLDAELARQPDATTVRIPLGNGTEAYEGVYAVAMRTPQGIQYFSQKHYGMQTLADRAVPALELVAQLVDQGLMPGFDVVRVLQSSADSRIVRLSLVEGLAVEDLLYTEPGNPAYRQVAERYRQALKEAARRLEAAGWKANHSSHERGDSLHVYLPGRPKGQAPLAFQVLESGVVATRDGRFVLIDPF